MGQKVHPIGFRLGIIRDWDSRWYARKPIYRDWIIQDAKVRAILRDRFSGDGGSRSARFRNRDAGISRIEIERAPNMLKLTLHTAKPGIIIGRGGRGVEDIRADIEKIVNQKVHINVQEVRQPELDAQLVAENVAGQIERRIAFKRAVRQAVQRSMKMGAGGIRVLLGGRLGGAEMSRKYSDREGSIPLHTLRADIDYGFTEASTASGNIGVKVWIYRGDVLPEVVPVEIGQERPAVAPTEKPRRSWRRVGVRKVEEGTAAETETASEEWSTASAEPATAGEAPAADEAASDESAGDTAEEQDQDVNAVEGQVSETTEGPSER